MDRTVLIAFALTTLAGLSTGIGSAMAFFARKTSARFLAGSLGFSAGVLIYVSFMDLLPEGSGALALVHGKTLGPAYSAAAFFAGILLMFAVDLLVPSRENPHQPHLPEEMRQAPPRRSDLLRLGRFAAAAIFIHNLPEGVATLAAAMANSHLGFSIALAVAIHNIPEGISISVPIFYSTGSRRKAFWLSFLSGLSEPVGACIGYVFLRDYLASSNALGIVFSSVAGIMVYVALDEILPAAHEYGSGHVTILGLVCGMATMAASLLLFA